VTSGQRSRKRRRVSGRILALTLSVFALLARTYPVHSSDLVADSLVGKHSGSARIW
jgi:hypothetical protein